ncbi:MAG TPA: bifunctional diguanylate cyclase/phosphodiesterase [Motiliproteus sp.]
MAWLKYVLLALLVMVFAASAVISGYRHTSDMKQLAMLQKTGVWALSELDRELQRFIHVTELVGLSQRTHDQLMLRYDLLWSRLQVLQSGEETREIREMANALPVLVDTELVLRGTEMSVLTLQMGQRAEAQRITTRYEPLLRQVRDLTVDAFNSQTASSRESRLLGMAPTFALSLLGMMISGFILVMMLILEGFKRRRQALMDELTGVPNRHAFNRQLIQMSARQRRNGGRMALMLVDLNDFKEVNDAFGHAQGDQLLCVVAKRIRTAVREEEVISRVGGDEFAVLLESIEHFEEASVLAQRVIEYLSRPYRVGGSEIFISISIGISFYPDDDKDIQHVLNNANTALVLAKLDSGSSYRLFESSMNEAVHRRKRLADDLRVAIANHELKLYYQPVVRLDSGEVAGVEALLRWHHEDLGYISPLELVSIAEHYGMALDLNDWVLHEACKQNKRWQDAGMKPMLVWVNISPGMYTRHDLVGSVIQALVYSGLEARWLGIEVTEDTTMRDIETSPGILRRLQELGVLLALDDFGTGYSSLSHLKRLPVSRLKIDRSFINDLNNQPCDMRFVQTLLSLAEQLNMSVVSEGIENQHQLRTLRNAGCAYGQGYLFSRPLAADELETLLRENSIGQQIKLCDNHTELTPAAPTSSGSEDESSYHPQPGSARY